VPCQTRGVKENRHSRALAFLTPAVDERMFFLGHALELIIYLNQCRKFRAELSQKHPSVKFDLDMTPGRLLTFKIRPAWSYSFFRSPTEHLMLGQPCFFKS